MFVVFANDLFFFPLPFSPGVTRGATRGLWPHLFRLMFPLARFHPRTSVAHAEILLRAAGPGRGGGSSDGTNGGVCLHRDPLRAQITASTESVSKEGNKRGRKRNKRVQMGAKVTETTERNFPPPPPPHVKPAVFRQQLRRKRRDIMRSSLLGRRFPGRVWRSSLLAAIMK